MSEPYVGHATSVKTIQGITEYCLVNIRAASRSGTFRCAMRGVTLNGKPAALPSTVAAFLESHGPNSATVKEPDWLHRISDGYEDIVECDSIELYATE